MAEYVCPKSIQDVYEKNPARGRKLSIEWASKLALIPGDRVWMPEGGWFDKGEARQDN